MKNFDRINKNFNHYDLYPFDYLSKKDEANIKEKQAKPFIEFISKYTNLKSEIAEIGCGPGRSTLYMTELGLSVTALDLSSYSLELAKERAPKGKFILGDNANLPFPSKSFDIVISDGVLHHTNNPEKSLEENARILKKGGKMYLSIYRKYGRYYFIYHNIGFWVRKLKKFYLGNVLIDKLLIPFYYLVQLLRSEKNINYYGAKNLFYDYFFTPIVFFKTKKEILSWSKLFNLKLLKYFKKSKNNHIFFFTK